MANVFRLGQERQAKDTFFEEIKAHVNGVITF